jgi:hypothetical protein
VVPGFRAPFPTTGRAIVDTVCGKPSELGKDQTFGVRVKPANIEEHFQRRRIDRERYIAANTETEGRDCGFPVEPGTLADQPSCVR